MTLTAAQNEAQGILASDATHIMLEGGSRSGKTYLLVRAVVARAIKAPESRHGIFRFRFSHVKASIVQDTFPKVMRTCWPDLKWEINKTDWVVTLPNKSEIWFAGLDDKERVEKVLGREFSTIYLNEISQIPFDARNIAVTRLAQKVNQEVAGITRSLPIRMYYDLNPTNKGHWAYKLFHEKRNPEGNQLITHPEDYASFLMNPSDNLDNLTPKYLDILMGLSARKQKRFMRGEWSDENPNALFQECDIDKWRVVDGEIPEMVRIVVAVDPSGAGDDDNQDNDAIGIVVGGVGTDGNAYLIEDCTVKAGPGTWGKVATGAYDRHGANVLVGEKNFGGEMVRFVIQTCRPKTNFRFVTASRGKTVRAEPFSALYEQGKVRHVGYFPDLEDELISFSTSGYLGPKSPNRADAWIWVLSELFPGIIGKKTTEEQPAVLDLLGNPIRRMPDQIARQNMAAMIAGGNSWMY